MNYLWGTSGRCYTMYLYIGGEDLASDCGASLPTVNGSTATWMTDVESGSSWAFVFTWYGLQRSDLEGMSATQAYSHGISDALAASSDGCYHGLLWWA